MFRAIKEHPLERYRSCNIYGPPRRPGHREPFLADGAIKRIVFWFIAELAGAVLVR
jgi:hypothetical protein